MAVRRRTRPTLNRTKPVRSWSAALGTPGVTLPPTSTSAEDQQARPRLEDAVSRSVELGYRVVDDYIQQGQRAAQRLSEGKLTAEVLTSEVNDLGGRIARYASDFFGAWVELLELAAVGSAARQQSAGNGDAATPATSAVPPPPRREPARGPRVVVMASRPVEVSLDFRAERVTGSLRAHDLRSADATKPRLSEVAIATDSKDGTPMLRIRVPDDHPDGTYEGLLIDESTNRPVGSVRLVISPGPPAARERRARQPHRRPRKKRPPR